MQGYLEIIMRKFGGDLAVVLVLEEAICAKSLQTDDGRRTPRHCISSLE